MKVKILIKALRTCDPNADVRMQISRVGAPVHLLRTLDGVVYLKFCEDAEEHSRFSGKPR